MASAQLVNPAPRCADTNCSRFAIKFVEAEPWMHHKVCSNHLSCRRHGSHCHVCSEWEDSDWDGLEALMARLTARQDWCRSSGRGTDDPANTSEDRSSRSKGRLIIDETPAMDVQVTTSLSSGKSPQGSSEHRGRASKLEMASVEVHSHPAGPSPAWGSEKRKSSKSYLSSRGALSKREGRGKHSSSSSSSKKKKSSSSRASSSKGEKREGREDSTGP